MALQAYIMPSHRLQYMVLRRKGIRDNVSSTKCLRSSIDARFNHQCMRTFTKCYAGDAFLGPLMQNGRLSNRQETLCHSRFQPPCLLRKLLHSFSYHRLSYNKNHSCICVWYNKCFYHLWLYIVLPTRFR